MTSLARITVYPIKSLDGIELSSAKVLPSGALANDRRYALIGPEGRFMNGKRFPQLHRVRASYDQDVSQITLDFNGDSQTFSLHQQREEISRWFTELLQEECQLSENLETGFPDDTESPGPTVISTGSLQAVSKWFPGLDAGETRRRFRANLELSTAEPFWEDQLIGAANPSRQFRIGKTQWWADKVCQRCPVPARDSFTGEAIEGFAKRFAELRAERLPDWSPPEAFDHFYRVTINTRLNSMAGQTALRVGDEVSPVGEDRS